MADSISGVDDPLDAFFVAFYRRRPVDASFIGVHDHDARLPDLSEAGLGDALADVESGLVALDGSGEGDLDRRLARGVLRQNRWELTGGHFARGNPSFATGEAVFGFLSLFLTHGGALAHRLDAARQRLEAVPTFLARARALIDRAPSAWIERAIREARGAVPLFGDGVDRLCDELAVERSTLRSAADVAAAAFAEHLAWLETDLARSPRESVAAGPEALDLYLRDGHALEASHDDVVAYARDALDEARSRLAEPASDGPTRGDGARPPDGDVLRRYRDTWDAMRALAEAHDLVTWPDFPIRYVPRPAWVREAAPAFYFLFYRSPAAFHRPPVHDYLVAPLDEPVTDATIKLNHVVHHGGLGHHVQNWNAFRAPSRIGRVAAVDGASRIAMPCGGTMAEGWACYATDLVGEFGGLTPGEQRAELHSRARMACRAVVDLELHRGRMGLDEAAAFYQEHAGMPAAAARGEAVKNSMFPGMAVMYLAGTDAIHRLRATMERLEGPAFDLRRFHDTLLSYGSVPVSLIARDMTEAARAL